MTSYWAEYSLQSEKHVSTEELDPISVISKVQQPIFIIHGTNDTLIPHDHATKL